MPAIDSSGNGTLIATDIRTALEQCGYGDLRRLDVSVHNGSVWLRGRVPSFFLKQIAQRCVQNVPGVREVNNDVTVGAYGR